MHEQFGVNWGDPVLFDLVLNTDRLSVDTCVAQIRALAERPEFAETDASRALLRGMALSARVRAALKANDDTQEVDVTIDSVEDQVTLRGIVLKASERDATEAVAKATPGVAAVDNQLRVMASTRRFTYSKT
jgi:hypothetical protein